MAVADIGLSWCYNLGQNKREQLTPSPLQSNDEGAKVTSPFCPLPFSYVDAIKFTRKQTNKQDRKLLSIKENTISLLPAGPGGPGMPSLPSLPIHNFIQSVQHGTSTKQTALSWAGSVDIYV